MSELSRSFGMFDEESCLRCIERHSERGEGRMGKEAGGGEGGKMWQSLDNFVVSLSLSLLKDEFNYRDGMPVNISVRVMDIFSV